MTESFNREKVILKNIRPIYNGNRENVENKEVKGENAESISITN